MRKKRLGQSTLEYAIIIAVVVGALWAINIYLKRGVQGKLRESTDQIGEQFEAQKTSSVSMTQTSGKTTQWVNRPDRPGQTYTDQNVTSTEGGSEEIEGWRRPGE